MQLDWKGLTIRRMPFTRSLTTLFLPLAFNVANCLVLPPALCGQSKPVRVIGTIHSSGQQRFSEAQVVAASGLRSGQEFDVNAVQAAVEKLGQSGAFGEVQFKYQPENGRMAVEFLVKEAGRFHRCIYDNLVWGSTKEMEDFVHSELPLFDGFAPEGGSLPDEISGAIEHFLQQRGISGHVERVQFKRSITTLDWEHLYSVRGPLVTVQSILFEGVNGIDEGLLQKEAKPLIGRSYSFVEFRRYGEASFLPVYRERGYLRAQIDDPVAQLSKQVQGPSEFATDVTYRLKEGLAYDWEATKWSGNEAKASKELDVVLGMKLGERANGLKIDAGWEAIQAVYGKSGYLDARLKPQPVYDEANRRVEYRAEVSEGPQYRMGTFSIGGLPPANIENLKSKWKLRIGDVYDASYMKEFLQKQLPSELQAFRGRTPKILTKIQPDRTAHIVHVSIQVQ